MKKLLAKYGKHFRIITLCISIFATYDYFYGEGIFFEILALPILILLYYFGFVSDGKGKAN
jgi:hypothetical protein